MFYRFLFSLVFFFLKSFRVSFLNQLMSTKILFRHFVALDFAPHRRQNVIVGTNNNNWTTCSVMGYRLMRLSPLFIFSLIILCASTLQSPIGQCAYACSRSLVGSLTLAFFRLVLELFYKTGARKSRQPLVKACSN